MSAFTRRQLLAAAAATPLAGFASPTSAGHVPQEVVPVDDGPAAYYVGEVEPLKEGEDGQTGIIALHTSRTDANRFGLRMDSDPPLVLKRYRFRPLRTEQRFRLVESEWEPINPAYWLKTGTPEREAAWDAYVVARDEYPNPGSLVDVPDRPGGNEFYHLDDQLMTRAAGLAEVARLNAWLLAEIDAAEDADGMMADCTGLRWWVLVEIGQTRCVPFVDIQMHDSGIGVQKMTRQCPLRLVRPTDAESALYPIPTKGGA